MVELLWVELRDAHSACLESRVRLSSQALDYFEEQVVF